MSSKHIHPPCRLSEEAFDDQCTGANPRYPLISDLKQIYTDAYEKPILPLKSLAFDNKGKY